MPVPVSKGGVCVVDGYGVRVRVECGRLVISDGLGPQRRESRFARATVQMRRLVLLGHTGFVTLDALRWLADVGVGFVHLDPDGRVLATSAGYGLDDPRLRRAQALAWGTPTGLGIARDLLRQKLEGQARVAYGLPDGSDAAALIGGLIVALADASSVEGLMVVEAAAAAAYWTAWSDLAVPWVKRDADQVPEHWRTVGGRTSPLTGSPRLAANPANAILNYLYALLEAEARLACHAAGLDPGLGFLHADLKARDSLALDVMEAVRPEVDAYTLELLGNSVFRAADFLETRQGVCRIVPPLSHQLAETATHWRRAFGPVVERVARAVAAGPASRVDRVPTKLTEANRSAGRVVQRTTLRARESSGGRPTRASPRAICRGCGAIVSRGQRWCAACRPGVLAAGANGTLALARAKRMALRTQGHDPATSPAARTKQRTARLERRHEELAWDREHPHGGPIEVYWAEIQPRLASVPLRVLARATGLSVTYCSEIRRGAKVPHRRWWAALRSIA